MKQGMRGSFTIEATVIIPIVLFVVGILFYLLFYYHDKNVIMSAAHETIIYGSYMEEPEEETLKTHMEEQVKGKLLLFSSTQREVKIKEEKIEMVVTASEGMMSFKVDVSVARTHPEKFIRSVQKMKKIGDKEEK